MDHHMAGPLLGNVVIIALSGAIITALRQHR